MARVFAESTLVYLSKWNNFTFERWSINLLVYSENEATKGAIVKNEFYLIPTVK